MSANEPREAIEGVRERLLGLTRLLCEESSWIFFDLLLFILYELSIFPKISLAVVNNSSYTRTLK